MSPKEKAAEIRSKMRQFIIDSPNEKINDEMANVCALVCVKEIQAALINRGEKTSLIESITLWSCVEEELKVFEA